MLRGEVYFVDLAPVQGREQGGRRPVLVVSSDVINAKPLVVTVIPGSRGIKIPNDYPSNVRVMRGEANLPEDTVFMAFQIRALDAARFRDAPTGVLGKDRMSEVDRAIRYVLNV